MNTLYDEKTEMFEDDAASDDKDLLSVLSKNLPCRLKCHRTNRVDHSTVEYGV